MSFYGGLRVTADRLLRDKGQAMTLNTNASGAYDPETGAAVTPANVACTGVILDYTAQEIDGTQIETRDRKIILSAVGLPAPPDAGDTITVQGAIHAIIDVKPLEPAGLAVIYTLQVRKGA